MWVLWFILGLVNIIVIIIIVKIENGLITLRIMVIYIGFTKNKYQNDIYIYIYHDGNPEMAHWYLPVPKYFVLMDKNGIWNGIHNIGLKELGFVGPSLIIIILPSFFIGIVSASVFHNYHPNQN